MSDTIKSKQNLIAMDTLCDSVGAIKDIVDSTISNAKFTISHLCAQPLVNDDALKTVKPYDKIKNSCKKSHTILQRKFLSFNNKEILKFTAGETIIDQQNPFKNIRVTAIDRKTASAVPMRRSQLVVLETVTQQLREFEREKERKIKTKYQRDIKREQQKNETNIKHNASRSKLCAMELITTEEVLKQSKYVKTYIKNPDPYFAYDPTVLIRLKSEGLKVIADKRLSQKHTLSEPALDRLKNTHTKNDEGTTNKNKEPEIAKFKKCSNPNYPELANLKIRTGSNSNSAHLNPEEVAKNAKKFDERVKILQINYDDDLDDFDGPLTKCDSCDELSQPTLEDSLVNESKNKTNNCPKMSTRIKTINFEEFQVYLKRNGLTLMPKCVVFSPTATAMSSSGLVNSKNVSVLQSLSNSIFATRRKTQKALNYNKTPPLTIYDSDEYRRYKVNGLSHNGQVIFAGQSCPTANSSKLSVNALARAISMDNIQIKFLRKGRQNVTKFEIVSPHCSAVTRIPSDKYSKALSTSIRKALKKQRQPQADAAISDYEWKQMSSIKEVIDKQLYYKVRQQQHDRQHHQASLSDENIYEHSKQQLQCYFVRQHQRNSFSSMNNRTQQAMPGSRLLPKHQNSPCYQSVMEGLKALNSQAMQPGYAHETETLPIFELTSDRRIGGLFTREEILEKVKEFCRKSFNRSMLPAATNMYPIYERRTTHNNSMSNSPANANTRHLTSSPQVPQRVQSFPRMGLDSGIANFSLPVNAHVNKRLLLNGSMEIYLSSKQNSKRSPSALKPSKNVLMHSQNGIQAAQLDHYNNSSHYMQSEYVNAYH